MTHDQLAYFLRRVEQAVETGIRRGLTTPRQYRHIAPVRSNQFLPFPTIRPEGRRLKLCFVSREYPPQSMGGIGRFTSDLAIGCARIGHEVHVITHSQDQMHTVDFEDGVWMHRLPGMAPKTEPLTSMQLSCNYLHCANVYHELEHIHNNRGLDLVSAPIWLCEGVIASLDDRWPTVLSLVTTLKTIQGMGGTTGDNVHTNQMIALEKATMQSSGYIHAVSRAMGKKCRDEAGSHSAMEFMVPLGTNDVRDQYQRLRPQDGKVSILFVGRLEPRKGVDVLLDAVYQVLPEFANAELVLAGRDNTPGGMENYESRWKKHLALNPQHNGRVTFTGEISEDDLQQHYADCDVLVLPSRYESFGLVLTEAMMHGKPVIAASAGGMVEIVEPEVNGYLFETDNANSLADALRKLLSSAERREQFGIRSRAIYEHKFSTEIMVRTMIAAHQKIVDHHRQSKPKPGTMASRLATLIHEVSSVPMETAKQAVQSLLVPKFGNQYTDYAGELTELWSKNDDEFVRGLYHLFLGRPADGVGLKEYLGQLSNGVPRIQVVEFLLFSEEARIRKTGTDWLAGFVTPATTGVFVAPVAAIPSLSLKGKILRVPGVGKGLRLLKHLAKLPITVRNISTQTQHVNAIVSDLHSRLSDGDVASTMQRLEAMQKQLAEELLAMRNRSSNTDRQLRWQLNTQSAKIEQLLAEIARMRGTSAAA